MSWLRRYWVRFYLRESLCLFPLLGIAVALGLVGLLSEIDGLVGWESDITAETAQAVLSTMAASMFTFVVFVSSALLVAVQLASSQLTPRAIAFVFRDPVTRWSLALFVSTFTLCLASLVRINTSVPLLTSYVAAYSSIVSIAIFLYLIEHVPHVLRPSGTLKAVGRLGREVIEQVHPRPWASVNRLFPSQVATGGGN